MRLWTRTRVVEITSVELKKRLDQGEKVRNIDVREPNGGKINRIPGAELIPLGDILRRYAELDPEQELVVQVRKSKRQSGKSGLIPAFRRFRKVNLKGGILDWIDKVDKPKLKY